SVADDPVLPADAAARDRRLGRAVGAAGRARHPAAVVGAEDLSRAPSSPALLWVLGISRGPKPAAPPDWYPARGWPLWFVGFAFLHVRRAGGLLTLGLILNSHTHATLP